MTARPRVAGALAAAGLCPDIIAARDLTGGCIHRVQQLTLADHTSVVVKINDAPCATLFEEEAAGLRALAATETVLVPRPHVAGVFDGAAMIVMSAIEVGSADDEAWRRFGDELAALHATDAGSRYGFDHDNHLGTTPQPNNGCDDWVEFNATRRLGHQLRLVRDARRLDEADCRRLDIVIDHLDRHLPRRPRPSLLHGDLWSGNALPAAGGRVAVIDPACSIGDGWADIAMMQLFGGFPAACFEAYAAAVEDHDGLPARIAVYQLYHVLNHVNLFGGGYAGQAMALARGLGA
ncbi:MAG: fructosamine kinase family protein [Planctomycetota bacterium]|jgi:fructosamine-3-kinase